MYENRIQPLNNEAFDANGIYVLLDAAQEGESLMPET
jgi:hypothetical protein